MKDALEELDAMKTKAHGYASSIEIELSEKLADVRRSLVGHYMHWLGVLRLLGECAVFVDDEHRETIERALDDAIARGAPIRHRRILNRIEVEIDD